MTQQVDLDVLTNEIEQGFMQLGGWKACRYSLKKLVADKDAEIKLLNALRLAARVALDTCQAGMRPLVEDGVRSQTFNSHAEQFAAAWRDLRLAVEATSLEKS